MGAGALAMIPGPPVIRECPGCHQALEQLTILSGNLNGAKTWTDGKVMAPMLPDFPLLAPCPHCGVLVWIYEARELWRKGLGQPATSEWNEAWDHLKLLALPSEKALLDYATTNKLTTEKEVYVRLRAWWLANDPYRFKEDGDRLAWSEVQRANLVALASLLDTKQDHNRHLKAEIARELGNFAECEKLLSDELNEKCEQTAKIIRALAANKETVVREVRKASLDRSGDAK